MSDRLRRVILRPYLKGAGPVFTLETFATGRSDWRGQEKIRYRFLQRDPGSRRSRVIFEGSDFAGSPMHADDSDATVAALLGFLTLRPGDTDRDYFEAYTPEQLEFCEQHAETVSAYVADRFGEY
jgi:hypothetical protein